MARWLRFVSIISIYAHNVIPFLCIRINCSQGQRTSEHLRQQQGTYSRLRHSRKIVSLSFEALDYVRGFMGLEDLPQAVLYQHPESLKRSSRTVCLLLQWLLILLLPRRTKFLSQLRRMNCSSFRFQRSCPQSMIRSSISPSGRMNPVVGLVSLNAVDMQKQLMKFLFLKGSSLPFMLARTR